MKRKKQGAPVSNLRAIPDGHTQVGEIVSVHGVDGTLKVYPTTDFVERLAERREIWIGNQGEPSVVSHAQIHGKVILLRIQGVTNRDQAEGLRGALLSVPTQSLPPLPEGEYYWHQLVGLEVREFETGRVLGQLTQVIRSGAHHDLFEVDRSPQKPLLIPALKHMVHGVDIEGGVMEVVLPDGLEDLT